METHPVKPSELIRLELFFSMPNSPKVEAGSVLAVSDNGFVSVHDHRQAPVLKRRFVPLYFNSDTSIYEPHVVVHDCHTPATSRVPVTSVHVPGAISATYIIEQRMLDSLKTLGIFDE